MMPLWVEISNIAQIIGWKKSDIYSLVSHVKTVDVIQNYNKGEKTDFFELVIAQSGFP